jgi:hypothetical protein
LLRTLGEDQKEKIIKLGQGESQSQDKEKLYDISVGTYDVTVKAGPSYSSQREETRETLIEIMRSVPGAGPYMADIIAEHMDFQGADKFAKRAKLMLPPNVQQAEAEENMGDMPPEVQQMMAIAKQTIEGLQKQVEQLSNEQAPEMAKIDLEKRRVDIEEKKASEGKGGAKELVIKRDEAGNVIGAISVPVDSSENSKNQIELQRIDLERQRLALDKQKMDLDALRLAKEAIDADS